jgi:hypothetical protein
MPSRRQGRGGRRGGQAVTPRTPPVRGIVRVAVVGAPVVVGGGAGGHWWP